MKTQIWKTGGLGLMLAILPLVSGCNSEAIEPSPDATNAPAPAVPGTNTAVISADAIADTDDLEMTNAMPAPPADLAGKSVPADVQLSYAAGEIARLAQAGVGEEIMLSFVSNSTSGFNLGSREIIYLNDLGVPEPVINAMIQRDQALKSSASLTASAGSGLEPLPPVYGTEAVDTNASVETAPAEPAPTVVNYNYFYDSLSPYGSWAMVDGYGWCWQPTVVVVNRGWQPYCDRGRWVYTDCGWYWQSDYSWGAVAFHYGRWFNHPRRGWCWYPERTWAPAWVSWRYDNDYCGWAPLSPSAHFSFGFGLRFGGGHGGLDAGCYTFVPWRAVCDPRPYRHRVPRSQAVAIYNNSSSGNNVHAGNHNQVINQGVPPERVTAATRRPVPHYTLREGHDQPRRNGPAERFDHANRTLVVNRPNVQANATWTPPARPSPANRPDYRHREPQAPATVTGDPQPVVSSAGNNANPAPPAPARPVNPGLDRRNDRRNDNSADNRKPQPHNQPFVSQNIPPAPMSPVVTAPAPVTVPNEAPRQVEAPRPNPVTIIGRRQPERQQPDNSYTPSPPPAAMVPVTRSESPRRVAPQDRSSEFVPAQRSSSTYTAPAQVNRPAPTPRPEPRPSYTPPVQTYTPPPAPSHAPQARSYSPPPTPAPAPAPHYENRAPSYSPPPAPAPAPRSQPSPAPRNDSSRGSSDSGRKGHDRDDRPGR